MSTKPNYGIPDIELPLPKGGTVNPSDFAGHELVVLFCPLDRIAAAGELADYNRHADQLSYDDAWMIAVCDDTKALPATRMTLAEDPDLIAWKAFGESLDPPEQLPREEGAVFLFGRGGCLTRAWRGRVMPRTLSKSSESECDGTGLSGNLRRRNVRASRERLVIC